MNTFNKKLAVFIFTLIICFTGLELAIRFILGKTDTNGNFVVNRRVLPPYHLPINTMQSKIDVVTAPDYDGAMIYHPAYGWTLRPNYRADPDFVYNSAGIRSPVETDLQKSPGVLRIAIFGDSFTHGDEVPYEETWGFFLEQALRIQGIEAEVLNFGLPGGAMDQAFLRWESDGLPYQPDIVIFGFQAENAYRNLYLIRSIRNLGYAPDWPFSKPRFVFQGSELVLVNFPPAPPEELIGILQDFDDWEYSRYEKYYDAVDYTWKWWHASRLLSLGFDVLELNHLNGYAVDREFYRLGHEPAFITLGIIEKFHESVMSSGAQFLVVHLPVWNHIQPALEEKNVPYADLLVEITTRFELVDPLSELLEQADNGGIAELFENVHYSSAANRVIAESLVDHIVHKSQESP